MKSIQRFLLIGLLATLFCCFLIIFLFNRYQSQIEVGELYDTQLAQTSRIVQAFVDRPPNQIDIERLNQTLYTAAENYNDRDGDYINNTEKFKPNEYHEYEHKFAIQVWDQNKRLLVKSPAAPKTPMAAFKDGYDNNHIGNYQWHIFTHQLLSNGCWVLVGERADVREEMVDDLTISSLIGPVVGMLLLALGVVVVIMKGLHPLKNLSQQISERHIDKFEPLELSKTPDELQPLGQAVNRLMERVSQDVERERRFLGDVAHELRTPLTAMKLNAQNGLNTKDPSALQNFLTKIVLGVDRSTRLIQQLLTLARLDKRALGEPETFVLGDIAQDVIHTLNYANSPDKPEIQLGASLFTTTLTGYPELVGVMLRNLLENACRHSPVYTRVQVFVEHTPNKGILLTVSDQGPGVSELQLESLGKRFFREQQADRMGSGLGLSIVARITELHAGQLTFTNIKPHGLQVSVAFPPQTVVSHH